MNPTPHVHTITSGLRDLFPGLGLRCTLWPSWPLIPRIDHRAPPRACVLPQVRLLPPRRLGLPPGTRLTYAQLQEAVRAHGCTALGLAKADGRLALVPHVDAALRVEQGDRLVVLGAGQGLAAAAGGGAADA